MQKQKVAEKYEEQEYSDGQNHQQGDVSLAQKGKHVGNSLEGYDAKDEQLNKLPVDAGTNGLVPVADVDVQQEGGQQGENFKERFDQVKGARAVPACEW